MCRRSRRLLAFIPVLGAALLGLLDMQPARAGNGYITTCEGMGCYGRQAVCGMYTYKSRGSMVSVYCYWY